MSFLKMWLVISESYSQESNIIELNLEHYNGPCHLTEVLFGTVSFSQGREIKKKLKKLGLGLRTNNKLNSEGRLEVRIETAPSWSW